MPENSPNHHFLLGNLILGAALVLLLYMGKAWEILGPAAMILWIALVAVGANLLMKDQPK